MGFSTASIQERFLADEPPHRQASIMEEKEAVFRALAAEKIQPLPGLMSLLDLADRANVPMAAITNAPRANAEMMLSGLGIAHRFRALVIGDELAHGKPHPLPYLEGLRATNAAPGASIAFEDSRSGVHSASAAGIPTVGIRTSLGHDDLVAAGAVMTAESFDARELIEMIAIKMNW
jgi:phosphoglycolate phosphatase